MGELGTLGVDDLNTYVPSGFCIPQAGGMEPVYQQYQDIPSYAGNAHYVTNGYPNQPMSNQPRLIILEQPGSRIRFRYQSERGSHGGMFGKNTTAQKKTYPTISLENFDTSQHVCIRASLWTDAEPQSLHVHKLQGKACDEMGFCKLPLGENHQSSFQGLGISFTAKKEVKGILHQRLRENVQDEIQLNELSEQESKTMMAHMNTVRIRFDALYNEDTEPFAFIFSEPVNNQKSSESGELKITRLSKCSGYCHGDEEVFLLCEKVNKKEIRVKFFDEDWEAFATFAESDVHHQVAIVFRTPPYKTEIDKPVIVSLQLYRPKDGEYSEPKEFTYRPNKQDPQHVDKKRKLEYYGNFPPDPNHQDPSYMSPGGYTPPSGGTGPSHGFAGSNPYGPGHGDPSAFQHRRYSASSPGESSSLDDIIDPNIPPDRVSGFGDILASIIDETGVLDEQPITTDSKIQAEMAYGYITTATKFMSLEDKSIVLPPTKSVFDLIENLAHSIHWYAKTGDSKAFLGPMRHLLAKPDRNGDNAFHLAIIHQSHNDELLKKLLYAHNTIKMGEFMAINQTNNEYQTPLHLAIAAGNPTLISLLLINGAKPEIQDVKGNTTVHLAVIKNNTETLGILLNKQSYNGATFNTDFLNIRNYEGNTALHLAVELNLAVCVTKLVDAGANINLGDGLSGKTPLHLAVETYHCMVPLLLKQMQIDVNVQDYAGNTVLHSACEQNSLDLAWQLMEQEANPLIENYSQNDNVNGVTPVDIAGDNEDLCNILGGQISESLNRKLNQARKLSTKEAQTSQQSDWSSSKSNETWTAPDVGKTPCPTDSGYASGLVDKIPENVIEALSKMLDPPCKDWEKLWDILVEDKTHLSNFLKLHKEPSPTKALMEWMENRGEFNIKTLRIALEAAELQNAVELLNTVHNK